MNGKEIHAVKEEILIGIKYAAMLLPILHT
jgi:hypothetical protein